MIRHGPKARSASPPSPAPASPAWSSAASSEPGAFGSPEGCPTWFNEGLASLYEQCDERDGEIVGLPNWRLADLQAAIQAHALRPLASLCATTTRQFYQQDSAIHYAQARYLCHYLQERGLLREYYRRFAGAVFVDPGGHRLLLELLGVDEAALEAHWRDHVLGLRFG